VTGLTRKSFEEAPRIEEIRFERGSQLRRLESGTFAPCKFLRPLFVPASVEFIGSYCFVDPDDDEPQSAIPEIIFEAGSKLREIDDSAFYNCPDLLSISLPASLEFIKGSSFDGCDLEQIVIDPANPFFHVSGGFIVDANDRCIIRYFGTGEEVTVPSHIETLSNFCFGSCRQITHVHFAAPSRLSVIEDRAFSDCFNLEAITIPATVTTLGDHCFENCDALQVASFSEGSQLTSIGFGVFGNCSVLKAIAVPATVQVIQKNAFEDCADLEAVTFTDDSKLVRIESKAFSGCCALSALALPPLVEFVGRNCFSYCASLSNLTLSLRIRELLDLPCCWNGWRAIPDSVERLGFSREASDPRESVFIFGRESRLVKVIARSSERGKSCQSFVQVSTRSLKVFRSRMEFRCDVAQTMKRSYFPLDRRGSIGLHPTHIEFSGSVPVRDDSDEE
jgi:hypothetical protein